MCIVNYKYVVNIVLFIEGSLSSLTGNFCCRMGRNNCYKRKKLSNRSAYQLFSFLHDGQMKNLLLVDPVKMVSMTILRNENLKKYLGET